MEKYGKSIKIVKVQNGYYKFKLRKLLEKNNMSINSLINNSNTDFKTIKRLMDGNLTRIDIDVLARICDVLGCNSSDLIEYVSSEYIKV